MKFKNGDRVKYIGHTTDPAVSYELIGRIGTIAIVDSTFNVSHVKFDGDDQCKSVYSSNLVAYTPPQPKFEIVTQSIGSPKGLNERAVAISDDLYDAFNIVRSMNSSNPSGPYFVREVK